MADESEMVERVARAMASADSERMKAWGSSFVSIDKAWPQYEHSARAAIAAMREPTEPMLDAPYNAEIDFGPGGTGPIDANALNVWQAMIDAALNKGAHD